MDDDISITLTKYKDETLPSNYDGFIDPDGYFIKVCERSSLGGMHDEFALIYADVVYNKNLKKEYDKLREVKPALKNIMLGPKDILINLFGYVLYEHSMNRVILEGPKYYYNGQKVTNAQMETALKLLELNKDDLKAAYSLVNDDFSPFLEENYPKR